MPLSYHFVSHKTCLESPLLERYVLELSPYLRFKRLTRNPSIESTATATMPMKLAPAKKTGFRLTTTSTTTLAPMLEIRTQPILQAILRKKSLSAIATATRRRSRFLRFLGKVYQAGWNLRSTVSTLLSIVFSIE